MKTEWSMFISILIALNISYLGWSKQNAGGTRDL